MNSLELSGKSAIFVAPFVLMYFEMSHQCRMKLEGVIKFHVEHETEAGCGESDIVELTKWRKELRTAGLVGQDLARYGGLGFGNLSKRLEDGTFLITASQTGHWEIINPGRIRPNHGLRPRPESRPVKRN